LDGLPDTSTEVKYFRTQTYIGTCRLDNCLLSKAIYKEPSCKYYKHTNLQ
jgi:hypothetical protein